MAKNKSTTKSRTAVVTKEMTLAELNKQESVIEQGEKTFVSVGNALIAIRDGKGYKLRGGYKTFEEYCEKKFNFGARHGQRLIEAAHTVNAVRDVLKDSKEVERIIPNEAVAREFAKVANKPATLAKVIANVQGQQTRTGGRGTIIKANAITQAIKEVAPSIAAAKPASEKKPSKPIPAHSAHSMSDICPACKVTPKTYERDESGFKCGKCHALVLLHVVSLTSNVCESCSAVNKAGATFCINCGEAL